MPDFSPDFGDIASEIDKLDLFGLKPRKRATGRVRLAGDDDRNRPIVDLAEEEQQGGHTISRHVNRSDEYLKSRVREEAARTVSQGDYFDGLGVGSFTSLQSANRLINSTLSRNQNKIQDVTQGNESVAVARSRFGSPTGYEAYLPRANSDPYMRDTFGVGVVILRDRRSPEAGASSPPILEGDAVSDDEWFVFTIYHSPVQFRAPVRGKKRFLRERAFLDGLVELKFGDRRKARPAPDPAEDFYMLDDAELEAYSAFRLQMDAEFGRHEK